MRAEKDIGKFFPLEGETGSSKRLGIDPQVRLFPSRVEKMYFSEGISYGERLIYPRSSNINRKTKSGV